MYRYVQFREVFVMVIESLLTFFGKIFCFTAYVDQAGSFPEPLSLEQEQEYVKLCAEGDMHAREMLIRHNLRLVAHVAKKYSSAGEADDLISVGTIGLIKGIETFELGKGSRIATYAAKCIDNEILMYIRANKKRRADVALSQPVGEDKDGNEISLMEILPADVEYMFTDVENDLIMTKIKSFVKSGLSDREREIIELRYGLSGQRALTQIETAQRIGISRSYVSRIEKRAIKKISAYIL